MKIVLEISDAIQEDEIIFRCKNMTDDLLEIQRLIQDSMSKKKEIAVYSHDNEYFLSLNEVLFFETSGRTIIAHTKDKSYTVKYKLYELECILPDSFVKVSKSAIVNVFTISCVSRNIATTGNIEFTDSYKHLSVSRMYHKNLKYVLTKKRG